MHSNLVDDKNLVEQAKQGSQEAFGALITLHEKKIYALCYRMTGNPHDAQDTAQEAFFSAWRSLPTFKGDSAFGTWLYRLATNACIDHLRKQKRRTTTSLSYGDDDTEFQLELTDPSLTPDKKLEQKEIMQSLHEGLDALPPHHRDVLLLRELSGLTYQEIAERLHLDLGTVKSRIARGRTALRNFLSEKGNFSL